MTVHEIKKKSGPPVLTCGVCGITQIQIGGLGDWALSPQGGHVCAKEACRTSVQLPKFVPPDERR